MTAHDPRRPWQALQHRASMLVAQGPRGQPVSVIDYLQRVDHRESLVREHALRPQLCRAVRLVRDRWMALLNAASGAVHAGA